MIIAFYCLASASGLLGACSLRMAAFFAKA